jgi:hypothetical protein
MNSKQRHTFVPAAIVATAVLIAPAAAFIPGTAQAASSLAALVTCSSTTPCASYQNKGKGDGVDSTAVGDGFHGFTTGSGKSGVFGESEGPSGYGVHGNNKSAGGIGVYATGGSGTGLEATSNGAFGIYSSTTNGATGVYSFASNGTAIDGYSDGGGVGVQGYSSQSFGVFASSSSPSQSALEADSYGTSTGMFRSDGAHLTASSGNGAVIANGPYTGNGIDAVVGNDSVRFGAVVGGKSFGLMATTGAGTGGYPLEASSANSSGTVTGFFYVDGSGGVHYTGTLSSYARTRGGSNVTAYETKSTQASVEDSGTAHLSNGSAIVRLDPAFAQSIDVTSPYRVFLTPGGDTRGLYVAQKTPSGFVVRETQGGRGSLDFDYRILATAAGHTGERMTAVTADVQAKMFPMLRAHASPSTFTGFATRPASPKLP